jgi:hypothetical protein
MVFTFIDWLVIGLGAFLGLKILGGKEDKPVFLPAPRKPAAAINRKIQPGDVIYMQNASPYGFEPDGNML